MKLNEPNLFVGDPCFINPCLNGGTCSINNDGGYSAVGDTQYYCTCPTGYAGITCQNNLGKS